MYLHPGSSAIFLPIDSITSSGCLVMVACSLHFGMLAGQQRLLAVSASAHIVVLNVPDMSSFELASSNFMASELGEARIGLQLGPHIIKVCPFHHRFPPLQRSVTHTCLDTCGACFRAFAWMTFRTPLVHHEIPLSGPQPTSMEYESCMSLEPFLDQQRAALTLFSVVDRLTSSLLASMLQVCTIPAALQHACCMLLGYLLVLQRRRSMQ